jgi:ribosomal protein L37AE/L43A
MLVFPHICPACGSAKGRRVIPQSPEVETFHCDDCGHEWSAPAPPPMRPVPERALPRSWFKRKKE